MTDTPKGFFTIIVAYSDYDAFKADPLFNRAYELMNVDRDQSVRVVGLSHADEATRARKLEDAISEHLNDPDALADAVDEINNETYEVPSWIKKKLETTP
jgi:hypothetical protein